MKKILFLSMLVSIIFFIPHKEYANKIDSLNNVISTGSPQEQIKALKAILLIIPDKEKAHFYNLLAEQFRLNNPIKSFDLSKIAKSFAQEYKNNKELAYSLTRIAYLYYNPKLKYDSAVYYIDKAIEILEKYDNCNELGLAYNYAGIFHADQGELNAGLIYFNKSENVYVSVGDYCRAATIHHNIGKLNKYSKSSDEVKKYFMESLAMYKKYNCEENYDFLYTNLSEIYIEQKQYNLANDALHKALEISKKYNNLHSTGVCFFSLGELYMHLDTSKAIKYYFKAKAIADSFNIVKLQTAISLELAGYFLEINKPAIAKNYMDDALEKSLNSNKLNYIRNSYNLLSKYYQNEGEYKKALKYYKLNTIYRDSIGAEKVKVKIMSLETEKKEEQIKLLNKENEIKDIKIKRNKNALIISFIVLFLLLLTAFIYYRYLKQKSKTKELIFEKQLLSTIVSTEDKERKRFASDLHDGLGPLLSSVKLYLSGLKNIDEKTKDEMIDYSIELIDESIKSVRVISNNILPVVLSNTGLVSSIQSFCDKIQHSKQIEIEIKDETNGKRFDAPTELILYRVIQELINNSIKHSGASKIQLYFSLKENNLIISYSDNGFGFDVEKQKRESKGIGLKNIFDRVHSLQGNIEFHSEKEKGINVKISIAI